MFEKRDISDLAIFSGGPAFDSALHVGRPNIGDRGRFAERVEDILDRRWLSNGGRYLQEFESEIAKRVGVKHCIVVTNATIGLEIAIRALDLRGEVIIPSFTFIATAHALQWLGITPVFCDIDPLTYNIDPRKVEQLITPHTSAIMGVHVYGRACDCDALETIARAHHLILLYDAAHAFGCSYKGRMIGGFGDVEVFSFHATKFLNSLEGGAVVTNNDELAQKVRRMQNFGFSDYDHVDYVGTNGKMNEVSAAMGLTNLESMQHFIDMNHQNYLAYREALSGIKGLSLIEYDGNEKCNYQYIVVTMDEGITGISRDEMVKILHAENVLVRRYFYPGCHQMEPYRSLFPDSGMRLPETKKLTKRVLCLPTGTGISGEQITLLCDMFWFVIHNAGSIKERLDSISGSRRQD
ncbi:MAG: aminotransferase class I/II-fold pyridoxal phosphate-dependent enzyme [Anaerolineales bacterium]|nr:aminotransferase class I/II-fold pyridoxal phosphate-dependent enzyme [Anaerolineales bacterium]